MTNPFAEIPRDKLLDNIYIASPCGVKWDSMTGDDRVRFCGLCQLNVYNLSNMTRQEATDLLIEKEGNLCVNYARQDGTIITKNCPVGLRKLRERVHKFAAVIAGVISFALSMGGACAKGDKASKSKASSPPKNSAKKEVPKKPSTFVIEGGRPSGPAPSKHPVPQADTPANQNWPRE